MPATQPKPLDVRVVLGKGLSGKSTLVRSWLKSIKGNIVVFGSGSDMAWADAAFVVTHLGDLIDLLRSNGKNLIIWYRPAMPTREDFDLFNRVAWSAENLTVVWEEIDRWADASKLPPYAFAMVNEGRHRGLRLIATARRPNRVSRDLTANASRIVVFNTKEPRDLAYLSEYMGRAVVPEIEGLGLYEALDWTEAGALVKKSPFP